MIARQLTARPALAEAPSPDRVLGCFLGLAVGDALGTTLEFEERDACPHHTEMVGGGAFDLPAGHWTDDTAMALCLADSLIACRRLNQLDFQNRLIRWWRDGENLPGGDCFDIGGTTRAALEAALDSQAASYDPGLTGLCDERSAGNGSLVRIAPIAILYGDNYWALRDNAVSQSAVTHATTVCLDACAFLALALARALAGEDRDQTLAPGKLFLAPEIKALAAGSWRGKRRSEICSTGYVVDTLEAALWAVGGAVSFEDALIRAVNLGGDADSIGAVAGQLAGAIWGAGAIPERWLSRLAWRRRIEERALSLLATRHTRWFPRPIGI